MKDSELIEAQKMYMTGAFTLQSIAEKYGVTKQYLQSVLNVNGHRATLKAVKKMQTLNKEIIAKYDQMREIVEFLAPSIDALRVKP